MFFGSVLVHEIAHSLVGRAQGIPVRKINLNMFGGAAQLDRDPPSAGAEIKMAIAGPVSSLLLAGLFYYAYDFYLSFTVTIAAVALWLSQINLIIAAFNMLPGFPMDGGRVMRAVMWKIDGNYEIVTRRAITIGRVIGWGIVGAGIFFIITYRDWFAGVWLVFIGLFLDYTARTSRHQFDLQLWLKARSAGHVVRQKCPRVEQGQQLSQLNAGASAADCYLVERHGQLAGVLVNTADETNKSADNESKVIPLDNIPNVLSDTDLLETVRLMNESGLDVVTVEYDGNNLIGLVLLSDLISLVNQR